MSSSPTAAKATEKEHKGNKEDNFSPYLRSIRWKEELAKSKSEIVRAVELSKLANGVVFVLEKRITKPPMSQKKAGLWEVLKALAPPDCPSMQADVKSFYKKLEYNLCIKQKNYSRNKKDWYTKSFVFPPPKKDVSPPNFSCQECQVLKCSLSKLQNDLDLKTAECNDLHSCLDLQKESFEKQMKGAVEKISDLEKQLQDFEQKHGDLQEELLLTKSKTNSYQKKFSSKCAALNKAHKRFGDVFENKTEKQANDNHVIHATKCDNNFLKRIFFGILHYGLSSGKKLSQGKSLYVWQDQFQQKRHRCN